MDYKINKVATKMTENEIYTYMWNIDGLEREAFSDLVFGRKMTNVPLKTKFVGKKVATNDGHEFVKYMIGLHNSLYGKVKYDLTKCFFPDVINRAVSRVVTNTQHQSLYYNEEGNAKKPTYNLSDIADAYASLPDEYMNKDVLLSFFEDPQIADEYDDAGSKIINRVFSKYGDKLKPSEVVRFLPYIKYHTRKMCEDVVELNSNNIADAAGSMIYNIAQGKNMELGEIDQMKNQLAEIGNVINDSTRTINMYCSFLNKYKKTPVIVKAEEDLQEAMYFIHSQEFENCANVNNEMKRTLIDVVKDRLSKGGVQENTDEHFNRHDALKGYLNSKKTQTAEIQTSQSETIAKRSNTNYRSTM